MVGGAGHSSRARDLGPEDLVVEIGWSCVPFRADRFEELWRPLAEASLEYGATWFAFYRSRDDQWVLKQVMVFPDKTAFERYWYSDEVAEARANASGLFEQPLLPQFFRAVAQGSVRRDPVES